jgi:hypothetical protein
MKMIRFCSNGHDQVSYASELCPVCQLANEFYAVVDEMEKELASLKKTALETGRKEVNDGNEEGKERDNQD